MMIPSAFLRGRPAGGMPRNGLTLLTAGGSRYPVAELKLIFRNSSAPALQNFLPLKHLLGFGVELRLLRCRMRWPSFRLSALPLTSLQSN